MTVAEKIAQHLKKLPESVQDEVLDFVEFLRQRHGAKNAEQEERDWSRFSLSQAMRGMEDEESPYQLSDIRSDEL